MFESFRLLCNWDSSYCSQDSCGGLVFMLPFVPVGIHFLQSRHTYLHFYHWHIGVPFHPHPCLHFILSNSNFCFSYRCEQFKHLWYVYGPFFFLWTTCSWSLPVSYFFLLLTCRKHFIFWLLTIYQLCVVSCSAELGEWAELSGIWVAE